MDFKALRKKYFPNDSEISEKKLKSNRRLWQVGGLLWVCLGLVFVLAIGNANSITDTFQKMAVLGGSAGGIGLCLSMYAQFRVLEAEASFELRLREALANAKA